MPPSTITTTPPDLRRFRQVGQVANHLAMAALLQAHNLLSLATGRHLREARAQEDPLRNLQGRLEEAELVRKGDKTSGEAMSAPREVAHVR